MYNHLLYLLFWVTNVLVLYLGNTVLPSDIVLGNHKFSILEAGVYSAFWITFFLWTMWDFVHIRGVILQPPLLGFLFFFFVNSTGVWLTSRFSHIAGLGVSSFLAAFLIGFVATIIQRMVWWLVVARKGTGAY